MQADIRMVARTLVIPHGFTLSIGGVLGRLIGERGYPGLFGVWLFVVAGGVGFCCVVGVSGGHREPAARTETAAGLAVFNLAPAAVVPCVYGLQTGLANDRSAFLVSGFCTVLLYVCLVAAVLRLGRRPTVKSTRSERDPSSSGEPLQIP